jgi:hypothetical protein
MWYRKVVSFGGGVDFSRNKSSDKPYAGVDVVKDIDNHPQGLYDELPGILKKMNKSVDDYYKMTKDQQAEIWDLLVNRPHRMNMDNNGQFIVSPQSAYIEARRHSEFHEDPEKTTLEELLEGSRQQNNNVTPEDSNASKRGEGFQHLKNGEGYTQALTGKQDPKLFGQLPSNQTWF